MSAPSGSRVYDQAEEDRNRHIRQRISDGSVDAHQEAVEHEAREPDEQIADAVNKVFDARPASIIRTLDLLNTRYAPLAAYGHMGREELGVRWEDTDKTEDLLKAIAE